MEISHIADRKLLIDSWLSWYLNKQGSIIESINLNYTLEHVQNNPHFITNILKLINNFLTPKLLKKNVIYFFLKNFLVTFRMHEWSTLQ